MFCYGYKLARTTGGWTAVGIAAALCVLVGASPARAQEWVPYLDVAPSAHTVSPEVRAMPLASGNVGTVVDVPIRHRPGFLPNGGPQAPDPVMQTTVGSSTNSSQGVGFDGVTFNGYYPPDGNVSVSGTQIVQTTNVLFAVYSMTGSLLAGPSELRSLWSALGGQCSTINGGDPVVLWDKIAHRWLITQIAYNSNLRQNSVCIAVSKTDDATGAFNLYSFGFSHLPDYPKFGVWSGSTSGTSDYYLSANIFSTALYYGPLVCAFNGGDMQTGVAARFVCSQGTTANFSLLPSDFDGTTPPAAGEPNYFVELGTGGTLTSGNTLKMFPFKATWSGTGGALNNPGATTLGVAPYAVACGTGGTCIPQAGTGQQVDSLGDRLMYRLAYL